MKTILLLVHDDEGQEARLQTALDLTRALDGHLTCIDVCQVPAVAGEVYGGVGTAMLLADERERESENRTKLQARLAHEDVAWNWSDATGDIANCVTEAANLADLIVLNRKLDAHPAPDMRDIAGRILMHARKPIVAVPETLRRFEATGRALIAWDGQTSSAATMRACVPLLRLASAVHIFMARDGAEKSEPIEAAEYLSRHGIHASINVIRDGLSAPDRLIGEECARWRADYCLMGAYSHGRLIESFGGVTKRMLTHSAVPLVLGH